VTEDLNGLSLSVSREIQSPFPKSYHLSVVADVGIIIPTINTPFILRWNLHKAKWPVYIKYINENIYIYQKTTLDLLNYSKQLPRNRYPVDINTVTHPAGRNIVNHYSRSMKEMKMKSLQIVSFAY
jgi:hypothetical protein